MRISPPLAIIFAAVSLVSIGGAYWLGKSQSANAPSAVAGPPPAARGNPSAGTINAVAVEVTKTQSARLAQSITAVGTLRSDESIVVRPEVAGRIAEIAFREGERVPKGQVLVKLDASIQRAELEQAHANLTLSKSKLDRSVDLQRKGFISSQAREEAENNFRVAQAAYDLASARLTKLDINAPFSGIVGLRQVSVGDYVKDGQDIVNLEAVDPLKVDFRVPEVYLKKVAVGQSLQIALDAFPDQIFAGRVFAINPLVDQSGRSIVIRAQVKNGEARLRPGMFARVRLLMDDNRDSLLVPEQSLIPQGDEKYVFKVVDDRAQRVKVEVGQRRDGKAEILQGLTAGDVVVIAGQLKIRDGTPVKTSETAGTAQKTAERDSGNAPIPAQGGKS
jgi:membrane fusion protein (multidrug efflux system)